MKPAPANTTEPEVIHFLGSVTLCVSSRGFGQGRVAQYGQELVVTDELRRLNSDRNGVCLFDLYLDEEDAQVRRFGKVVMRRGPWPDGVKRVERGSQAWWDEKDSRRKAVWREFADHDEVRARLLRELDAEYGRPTTSRTIAQVRGDDEQFVGQHVR